MVQKRETKAINKLCVRDILSLSFVCGAYFFGFRGRNLVCFVIAYNFKGKYAPEAGRHACALRFSRVPDALRSIFDKLNFKVFRNVFKHCLECLMYLFNGN